MNQDNSNIIIILENNVDKIINGLFQLQITNSNAVSLFLKEHDSPNLISLQDTLNEKTDLIISKLSEEDEPVPPPVPPTPPPQNMPPPPPPNNTFLNGYGHHHGGHGFFGRGFRRFNSGMMYNNNYSFHKFRNQHQRSYNQVHIRNTPDFGSMSAFDLYVFISTKYKQWKRLYSKYKMAKTDDDIEMIKHYSDKLKDLKIDIETANHKLMSKIEQMSSDEKKTFAKKKSIIAKQIKAVNKFKD